MKYGNNGAYPACLRFAPLTFCRSPVWTRSGHTTGEQPQHHQPQGSTQLKNLLNRLLFMNLKGIKKETSR
jgi:hypothetical protein